MRAVRKQFRFGGAWPPHPKLCMVSVPAEPYPVGEGWRWVAFGFNALGLSDHEILAREFIVYDALYAECQRRVQTK